MLQIEINNKTNYSQDKKGIENAIFLALKEIKKDKEEVELSLAFVREGEMKKINTQYRKKLHATDVLSFCYEKNDQKISGEIILCPKIIQKNARIDEVSFKKETLNNIIHGTLHIFGYEHSKNMFAIQEKILKEMKA